MIPKIIHYCWVGGGPKSEMAKHCIATWRKYMPDYEIREWNAENFNLRCNDFVAEAYAAKKWAFVSDYVRFWALYEYGGVYFDSDVELIKPIDHIVERGPFMALQWEGSIDPGSGIGAEAGMEIYREILDGFQNDHFVRPDGSFNQKVCPQRAMEVMVRHGFKDSNDPINCDGIVVYPKDYFAILGAKGQARITSNTVAIHHHKASWHTQRERFVMWVGAHFGVWMARVVSLIMHNPLYILKRVFQYLQTQR